MRSPKTLAILLLPVLLLIVLLLTTPAAFAQALGSASPTVDPASSVDGQELTASDGAPADYFGLSSAIDGSTLVVGAPYHTVGSNSVQGAAYVYTQNSNGTWTQQAELTASDGAAGDAFGTSVAISGSTIVVGAPSCSQSPPSYCGAGKAYVFAESGGIWSQQAELTASDGMAQAYFGVSVGVSGNTALIGASEGPTAVNDPFPGVAYVFVGNNGTWSQQAELTPSDPVGGEEFGGSVAIDGSTLVVGVVQGGAAYMFSQNDTTWSQQQELTAPPDSSLFGLSVALDGGTLVVGAPYTGGDGPGAAYVFAESAGTWSLQQELTPPDGKKFDWFAGSVAVSGSTIVVGADAHPNRQDPGPGAAYVFIEGGGTWSQQAELTGTDSYGGEEFGRSVAVSGGTILVGTPEPRVSPEQDDPGSAFVFAPALTLSPTSISFGNVAVNNTSAAKTATLKNTGTAPMYIGNIAASSNFAVSSTTCGAALAVGKTCKVNVTFTPSATGAATGTLTITDDAQNSPQTVALSGTGVNGATLTPASATFAKTAVGNTSAAKTFMLSNSQPVALTGISISTTGPFSVSTTTCGTSLAAKAKCTISVTFSPTGTGTATGQLTVSDSANNSPQTSSLSGTGD